MGKRHLKTQGSCKIGHQCPAKIKVIVSDKQECVVSYALTHSHKPALEHLRLQKEERLMIAQDLSNGIPFHTILDKIRTSVSASKGLERIHLLEMKDLHNIVSQYNLDVDINHTNDGTSVDIWVKQMEETENSCVVFYKPQGIIIDKYPHIDENDFILIIMNKAQQQVLTEYGKDVICMDGTHGTNAYGFELTTVLVLDELRQGFPCVFLITSRTDSLTLSVCLEEIKSKTGNIICNVFMSDMAPALYNAWTNTMGEPRRRIFCSWHVDRAWRQNILYVEKS
uniref:MULE transposase domain-containing protein n=1 Tax=Cacopsylla melanoneura TaxID=428564 RepID=A0A8D8QQK5_9HEMI